MPNLKVMLDKATSRHMSLKDIDLHGLPFSYVLIFGAGSRGTSMLNYFKKHGATTLAFIDNSTLIQSSKHEGLPVLSLEQAKNEYPEVPIFIASHWHREISKQLLQSDMHDFYSTPLASFYFMHDLQERYGNEVETVYNALGDEESRKIYASIVKTYITGDDGYLLISTYDQYFNPHVRPKQGDVVIDGGAFNGITAKRFQENAKTSKIISFEPTSKTYEQLVMNTNSFRENSICINKALWANECSLRFVASDGSPQGNSVSEHGTATVEATSIDTTVTELNLEDVDLIKLDVEGAELESLKGAVKTIERFHPKLQVCLYHNIDDLWVIPLYIMSNFSGYKFYIGHHAVDPHESILYAV